MNNIRAGATSLLNLLLFFLSPILILVSPLLIIVLALVDVFMPFLVFAGGITFLLALVGAFGATTCKVIWAIVGTCYLLGRNQELQKPATISSDG